MPGLIIPMKLAALSRVLLAKIILNVSYRWSTPSDRRPSTGSTPWSSSGSGATWTTGMKNPWSSITRTPPPRPTPPAPTSPTPASRARTTCWFRPVTRTRPSSARSGSWPTRSPRRKSASQRNDPGGPEVVMPGSRRQSESPNHGAPMAIEVRIPTILRTYTGGAKSVEGSGATLDELLADLEARHGGLRERLVDDRGLRRFVNVYLNDEDARNLGGPETPVSDGDTVTVLPAVAGGA